MKQVLIDRVIDQVIDDVYGGDLQPLRNCYAVFQRLSS